MNKHTIFSRDGFFILFIITIILELATINHNIRCVYEALINNQ